MRSPYRWRDRGAAPQTPKQIEHEVAILVSDWLSAQGFDTIVGPNGEQYRLSVTVALVQHPHS